MISIQSCMLSWCTLSSCALPHAPLLHSSSAFQSPRLSIPLFLSYFSIHSTPFSFQRPFFHLASLLPHVSVLFLIRLLNQRSSLPLLLPSNKLRHIEKLLRRNIHNVWYTISAHTPKSH